MDPMTFIPANREQSEEVIAALSEEIRRCRKQESRYIAMYDASTDGSTKKKEAVIGMKLWADGRLVVEKRLDEICDRAEAEGWL